MPKILLVNPIFNIPKENYDSSISVGLLCLASYLDEKGVGVRIIDGARQEGYLDLIRQELPHVNFVGISVMTSQVAPALEISQMIRDFNPNLPIIWGGLHPTFFPKETVQADLVDIVVMGEGEKTLLEIVTGKALSEIKGVAFKKDNQIQINPMRALLSFESLPLPKWDLMPEEILKGLALVPTHTSRGCPHRCAFCVNAILKNRWRARKSAEVLDDLRIIKNHPYLKDKPVRFWDEDFFVDKKRVLEIIRGIIEKKFNLRWETTIRADYLDESFFSEETLVDLGKSGCYLLSFGAESGSEKILKKIQKDINVSQILNSAKRCLNHKIIPQYSFMVGLPGEKKEDVGKTVELIDGLIKMSPKVQILGPQAFRPYPGSTLYQECLRAGWQAPQSLTEWARLMKNELNYLSPRHFPWIEDVGLVESLEAYVRFGAHPIANAMASTVRAGKLLKLGFILLCKLRWQMKFFKWPIEFKNAQKFVTKT